ncbi:hypothetical protein COU18_00285 [Candidatus Kaiserbacteria bacterium CG10_big_fil_rev_8_21_14_0_10_51_14]|uniref:Uncharacterized protein n=1 Tax=Candidatus Kaiserbacteria bacterium CG10_big_fil_rev_8_21_14_0_10_51_14 TaxID=1974610 RepID=A0A2H0UCU6_9BACT|nr:MAG: hypothetical protein COU18_00285 [Candidatus Kaiserbacteria bacterium CG10_big_fil_rev_8_21_14_0_10_51_14]
MNTSKISGGTGGVMICFAMVVDGMQGLITLIPFIGFLIAPVMSIFAALLFGIWFSHNDVSMMDPKRVLGFGGTILGEVMPIVNVIPFWTGNITYTVIQEWRRPSEI